MALQFYSNENFPIAMVTGKSINPNQEAEYEGDRTYFCRSGIFWRLSAIAPSTTSDRSPFPISPKRSLNYPKSQKRRSSANHQRSIAPMLLADN